MAVTREFRTRPASQVRAVSIIHRRPRPVTAHAVATRPAITDTLRMEHDNYLVSSRASRTERPWRSSRPHSHAAYRAYGSVGRAGGRSWWLWWAGPCEGIGAAQGVGQPVPAGHVPDRVRRVGGGHSGRGDEQRAGGGSARDRHGASGLVQPRRPPSSRDGAVNTERQSAPLTATHA